MLFSHCLTVPGLEDSSVVWGTVNLGATVWIASRLVTAYVTGRFSRYHATRGISDGHVGAGALAGCLHAVISVPNSAARHSVPTSNLAGARVVWVTNRVE